MRISIQILAVITLTSVAVPTRAQHRRIKNFELPPTVKCKPLQDIMSEPPTIKGYFCQNYMIETCGEQIYDDIELEQLFRQKFCFGPQKIDTKSKLALTVIENMKKRDKQASFQAMRG